MDVQLRQESPKSLFQEAKFVVIVRNPADRAYSLYHHVTERDRNGRKRHIHMLSLNELEAGTQRLGRGSFCYLLVSPDLKPKITLHYKGKLTAQIPLIQYLSKTKEFPRFGWAKLRNRQKKGINSC